MMYVDEIMLEEYDTLQSEVSGRKQEALALQHSQDLIDLMKIEMEALRKYVVRLENERDYYAQISDFQGP